jgi:hypothetical protein
LLFRGDKVQPLLPDDLGLQSKTSGSRRILSISPMPYPARHGKI